MESKQDWSQNNQAKSSASVNQCRSPRVQGLGENQGYLPLTRAEDIKAELSKDLSGSQLKVIAIKWAKEFPWGCSRISALFCWAALLRVTKTSVTKTSVTHLSHPYVHLHFPTHHQAVSSGRFLRIVQRPSSPPVINSQEAPTASLVIT